MGDIALTYEKLYSMLRAEKESDEVQVLDSAFYAQVVEYLSQKQKILDENEHKSDLFSAAERENTVIQLKNVKRLLKELYSRRESKIIALALNKSRTDSDIINTGNLLGEELAMYNSLVSTMDTFRKGVHDHLVQMRLPFLPGIDVPIVDDRPMIGGGSNTITSMDEMPKYEDAYNTTKFDPDNTGDAESAEQKSTESAPAQTTPQEEQKQETKEAPTTPPSPPPSTPAPAPSPAAPAADSTLTIKFLQETSKFVGKELEIYGPYAVGDISTLPADIAKVLISRGSAQEI